MKLKAGTLKEYLIATLENAAEHSEEPPKLMNQIHQMDQLFQTEFFSNEFDVNPYAGLLAMNSYMMLLAGVREALSGHQVTVFPTIRTALESASYCYLVAHDEEKGNTWINRHSSKTALQKCRKTFTVKKVIEDLMSISPEMAEFVSDSYEACIDFGAHPNLKAVSRHLTDLGEIDVIYQGFNLTGVYGKNSWEVNYSLLVCIEVGQAIAFLFACSVPNHPLINERLDVYQRWINEKNKIVRELAKKP